MRLGFRLDDVAVLESAGSTETAVTRACCIAQAILDRFERLDDRGDQPADCIASTFAATLVG